MREHQFIAKGEEKLGTKHYSRKELIALGIQMSMIPMLAFGHPLFIMAGRSRKPRNVICQKSLSKKSRGNLLNVTVKSEPILAPAFLQLRNPWHTRVHLK